MRKFVMGLTAFALMGLVCVSVLDAAEEAPKYTIKQVMQKAHKGGLLKKALAGDASKDELKQLHAYYVALSQQKPKKGDLDQWKEKTSAILKAYEALVQGKDGAAARLKAVTNCGDCHKPFK